MRDDETTEQEAETAEDEVKRLREELEHARLGTAIVVWLALVIFAVFAGWGVVAGLIGVGGVFYVLAKFN